MLIQYSFCKIESNGHLLIAILIVTLYYISSTGLALAFIVQCSICQLLIDIFDCYFSLQ